MFRKRSKSALLPEVRPKGSVVLNEEMGSTSDEENVAPQDNVVTKLQDKLLHRDIKSRINISSNKPALTKAQLEEQKQKWREARHSRLMSRLVHKRPPMESFSSAVFGFKSNTNNEVVKCCTSMQSVAAKSNVSSSMIRSSIVKKTIIDKKINQSSTNIKPVGVNIHKKMNATISGAETAKSRLGVRHTLASQLRMAKVAPRVETSRKASIAGASSTSANTAESSKKESVYERLFKAVPKRVIDNQVKPTKDTLATKRPPFNSSARSVLGKNRSLSAPNKSNAQATSNAASSRKMISHEKPATTPFQRKPLYNRPGASEPKKATSVKPLPVAKKLVPEVKIKPSTSSQPLRRSLTTVHVQHLGRREASRRIIRRSKSVPSIIPEADEESPMLQKFETTQVENDGFLQLSTSHRNSRGDSFFVPIGTAKTPSTQPRILKHNLAQWLDKQGKPVDSFRHLSCFGCSASEVKQQLNLIYLAKERATPQNTPRKSLKKRTSVGSAIKKPFAEQPLNVNCEEDFIFESLDDTQNKSYNLTYSLTEDSASEVEETVADDPITSTPNAALEKQGASDMTEFDCDWNMILGEALSDLCTLIQSGYPRDECEAWLMLVRKQCRRAAHLPLFWECFAALEEARGHFNSAVDYYERAIEHGAEVDSINEALDRLMKKFSALKVKSEATGDGKPHASKTSRKCVDRKNEFKSSAIKFTLQEKVEKKDNLEMTSHFVATPVRRSTRPSRGHFSSTPRIRCVNKLDQLELSERRSLIFHSNTALESRL